MSAMGMNHCVDCGRRDVFARGLCKVCYARHRTAGTLETVALPKRAPRASLEPIPEGSRRIDGDGYADIRVAGRWIAEHRHIMAIELGRNLLPGENVHHINGVRDDNSIANLELWFSPQPYGQRVSQLLGYVVTAHREELVRLLAL